MRFKFIKVDIMKNLVVLLLAVFTAFTTATASAQFLYGVSPYDDMIRIIDPTTGIEISTQTITAVGQTVTGANGMASHPITDELFIIFKASGVSGRLLGTINPGSGVVTEIGNTGDNFSAIAFNATGVLYGVTGDGANTSETLFTINTTTAAATLVLALGAGSDGEVIAFCPVDGLMYHQSGRDTNRAFESIDLNTLVVTPIVPSGFNTDEVFGMTWDADAGHFLLSNIDRQLSSLTTGGIGTLIATWTDGVYYRGLTFSTVVPVELQHFSVE